MTNYYIEKGGEIVLHDTDKQQLITTLEFMPQYQGLEIQETENLIINGVIMTEDEYKAEQAKKRQNLFESEFFNTSLGYIRRKVTMANGDTKDFLTDLLPSIAMGIQLKQPVSIIAYKKPDFTEKLINLVKYQEVKQATGEFVQECFMQLNNDFLPTNIDENNGTGETSDETGSNPPVDNNEEGEIPPVSEENEESEE